MPIFEYKCQQCGSVFERIVGSYRQSDPPCPECESTEVERLLSAAAVHTSGATRPPACGMDGKCCGGDLGCGRRMT